MSGGAAAGGRGGLLRRLRGRRRSLRRQPAAAPSRRPARLELLEPVRDRLAREIGGGARHLHERELERQPRVAALAHVVDRDREQVDQPDHRRLAELVRLRAQPLARLLGHGQRLGHLAHVLHEQQMAQVLDQLRHEAAEIVALLGELLDERERARGVAVDDEVAEPEERLLLDRAEQLQHRLHRDLALGRGGELVERRRRVAERAARRARDERERLRRRVDALALGDARHHGDEILQARPLEDERLAARAHGRQHLRQVGRAEDEDEMRRRLLDQLQERVPRRVRQLVRLVEDVDLVAALDRLEHDAVADLADVVDAALRRRVHLDHVERRARGDRRQAWHVPSGSAVGPLRAVQALREDARHRRLAGAARAGEEIGLAHLSGRDRVLQRPDDRLLADDLGEGLRAVFPVEGGHGTIQAGTGARRTRSATPGPPGRGRRGEAPISCDPPCGSSRRREAGALRAAAGARPRRRRPPEPRPRGGVEPEHDGGDREREIGGGNSKAGRPAHLGGNA